MRKNQVPTHALAADVSGKKTAVALFAERSGAIARVASARYSSKAH